MRLYKIFGLIAKNANRLIKNVKTEGAGGQLPFPTSFWQIS